LASSRSKDREAIATNRMLPIDPSRHVVKKTLAKLVSGIEPTK
jgi:hypothetical protein